jgi:hypothetical protein
VNRPTVLASRSCRPLRRWLAPLLGLLAMGATMAAPAGAAYWVQGIPGASCTSSNYPQEGLWRLDGRRIRNTGTGPYEVFLATCAISLVQKGWDPLEYRITLTDPEERDAYCRVYSSNGTLVRTDWTDWSRYYPVWNTIDPPLGYASGWTEMTFHCLLHPGASLDRIEILWNTP